MRFKPSYGGPLNLISLITLICFCCLLLLPAGCSEGAKTGEIKSRGKVEIVSTNPSFVTRQELNSILASSSKKPSSLEGRIISAVVPHHLVAGHLLVNALETLDQQEPGLVILVGPNHFNKGGKAITGYNGWQTPEGVVQTEESAVRHLLEKGLAVRDEEILSGEHSVGALVPLIQHYLPKARIVPIVLHHDVSLQEVDALLNTLEPFLDEKAVLLSSVDFSHYLTRSEAQAKDMETIRYMKDFDYAALYRLGNDYLDSPASLSAAFRLAEKRGIKEFSVLDNTNSGIILQNDFIETTSYFTLVFSGPYST